MKFSEYLEQADEYIRLVNTDSHELTTTSKLANYAKLFDLLLIDSEEEDNIFAHINEASPEEVYSYVQKLYILNKLICQLPDTDPHKELLQERLLNNINISAFDEFNEAFLKNPQQAANNFIKTQKPEPVAGTVEVRTWGTVDQYGSGLKSTIDKKLRGDDVGHAALVMTVAANEKGLELINKYCLDEDGLVKIPFELKKVNGETVYEIYWSYWPGRLATMESDFQKERGGLEYRDVAELERAVPRELSENYVLHKSRGNKEISLASASERTASKELQTTSRAQFLKKQDAIAKLEEEVESLKVLKDNYLASGKEFSPEATTTKLDIKPKSNFLTLLARFKKELGEDKTIAQILTAKKISNADSQAIVKAIDKLIKDKEDKVSELNDDCKKIIQKNHLLHKSEQRVDEVTKEQRELLKTKNNLRRITPIHEHLLKIQEKNPTDFPIMLSKKMMKALDKADWYVSNANEGNRLIYDVVKAKSIKNATELGDLITHLDKCKQSHLNELATKNKGQELKTELLVLQEKYQKGRKHFIEVMNSKIETVDKKIAATEDHDAKAKLVVEKEKLEQQLLKVRICSTYDYRDLKDKKLRRGIPYQANVLQGFDIEKMLQVASAQAEKTDDFVLKAENCSTTSMRILEAGAPEQTKILFKSSKPPVRAEYEFKRETPPEVMEDNTIYITITSKGRLAYSMKDKDGNMVKEKEIPYKGKIEDFKLTEGVKNKIVSIAISNGHAPEVVYDSEAFLTNPQAVHSASKLCKQVEKGGPQAAETLDKVANEHRSKASYYKLMNELADTSDSDLNKLKNKEAGAIWGIIKKFLFSPKAIVNFVKEFFFQPKEKPVVAVDNMLNHMKTAIEKLSNGKFLYVQAETPHAALNEMLQRLKESPTAIPFFKNSCLDKIRSTILQVESKEDKTEEDNLFIDTYNKVMHERNTRMATMEDALATGVDVKAKLLAHKNSVADLDFPLSPEQLAEHQVSLYEKAFAQKRNDSYLPNALFNVKHSFITKLNQYNTYEDKLKAINDHIERNPGSMSAEIMKDIESSDFICKQIVAQKRKSNPNAAYVSMVVQLGVSPQSEEPEHRIIEPTAQSTVPTDDIEAVVKEADATHEERRTLSM